MNCFLDRANPFRYNNNEHKRVAQSYIAVLQQ